MDKMTRLKLILVLILAICCSGVSAQAQIEFDAVEDVSLTRAGRLYNLDIAFSKDIKFVPRIHLLPNGLQIFLSFNREVVLPSINQVNKGIVKGYFFEKFGRSSLMFIMALNKKVEFIKKKYTKHSIRIVFRDKPTVIIDAGHGGRDPGTRSPYDKYNEKNITLIMAIELRNALMKTNHYNVILTRDSDKFVSLDDRIAFAKANHGDLLISIHTDYNDDKKLRGMSVYTLPPSGYTEEDKAFNENLRQSKRFSRCLIGYIPNLCKIKQKACRSSDLKILKTNIPSVLVELGCISNKKDSKLLLSKLFRGKIICAILYSVDQFFGKR